MASSSNEKCYQCGRTPSEIEALFAPDAAAANERAGGAAHIASQEVRQSQQEVAAIEGFISQLTKDFSWDSVQRDGTSFRELLPGLGALWRTFGSAANEHHFREKHPHPKLSDVAKEARRQAEEDLARRLATQERVVTAAKFRLPARFQVHSLNLKVHGYEATGDSQGRPSRTIMEGDHPVILSISLCPVCSNLLSQAATAASSVIEERNDPGDDE
jgi:hypothetical protein